jgi:hypothetical protein
MTTNSRHPSTISKAINGLIALALGVFVLAVYWPTVTLFELSRSDLEMQGAWIGGHAKRITAVTPGGVADRAGLKPGDVLEFDPGRDADWVLASYRNMPEGFSATLPVRHADGTRQIVTLAPERVAYLPSPNDRLAYLARICGATISIALGVFMVWARPGLMTWSLLLAFLALAPQRPWVTYHLAYEAGRGSALHSIASWVAMPMVFMLLPFALSFPYDDLRRWSRWRRVLGVAVPAAMVVLSALMMSAAAEVPFERATLPSRYLAYFALAEFAMLASIAALVQTHRTAVGTDRARLKWALLGMSAVLVPYPIALAFGSLPFWLSNPTSGITLTPANWVFAVTSGVLFPLALGVAVLRHRVVDIQFAVSRTLVYGTVSTLVLVFLAAVNWLLERVIENSGLANGLEVLAAIGLGLVLHRATHTINQLVDRVLFRKHHRAEERLRRVTAALPFAGDERSIAEALVTEPTLNLNLASAALFYRETGEGAFRRVLARGWGDAHVESLDADSFLVRYLQAEHEPLKLDDPQLLPAGVPDGAALPVLALPIMNQRALIAVVLYGAHMNFTLLDPDEIELLHALAKAAAASHSQVRVATLARQNDAKQTKIVELEASLRALGHERLVGAEGGDSPRLA